VAKSFSDPRVKVFELGSMSFQDVLVYALENAQTEWLARMDADDLSFPDRFEKQVEVIAQQPDVVLVGTRCAYLTPFGHIFETRPNASSREIGPLNLRLLGDEARFFADASVIFRRNVALEVGGYDPEFQMGDVPLWFRILRHGKGWEIARPLYLYRLHPDSMGYTQVAPTDELYRLLVKYAPDLLHLHFPEETDQPKPVTWHQQYYWLRIAAYEALTGDREAILQAVNFLDRKGPLNKEARLIRMFTYLGPLGTAYYRWHRRNKYRHRPDWEKLFDSLIEPLTIDQRIYA
jgi:glycosyltransferase involved in cell wall biosynthesis